VRAAGLGCFYWSWLCLVGWVGIGLQFSERGELVALAVAGALGAVATWRSGVHLLRRKRHAVRFGRRVAATAALHAAFVLVLAAALGDASWSGPAGAFAALSLALAWLVVAATRQHAPLFAAGRGQRPDARVLPAWLALVLSKRQAQRRANLLVSASQTMPGA
jgi:CHASE2 domain-containing sensor protein